MSDRAEILRQFCDVTGAPEERSRFFLDSSNWQLEMALSSFFETGGNVETVSTAEPSVMVSSDESNSPPPARPQKPSKQQPRGDGQRIATLSTLHQSDSSDEEEGQAFYAGGSERSGQQILGPNRNRDFVSEMFKSVRARGAVAAEDEEPRGRQSAAFSGTGYRLGQTVDDHTVIPSARTRFEEPRSVNLQLYRHGFTVDDGPLREYSDPDNAAFLDYIRRGEIPPELAADGEVRVSLQDRRLEQYVAGSAPAVAFAGKGRVLGSPTPTTAGAPATVAGTESDRQANERAARTSLNLDETQPITTLQIRLADGNRLIARFNHTHRVSHIRDYITTAMPEYQVRNFVLMTTFPNAELKDPNATVAEANLLNSVVVQRLV